MAIKYSSGKLSFGLPFEVFIEQQISNNGIDLLEIRTAHIKVVATLPLHHRDPFDRLLVAQGLLENVTLVTSNSQMSTISGLRRRW